MGGLGNQMFQYAFARSLSLHANINLKISTRYLINDSFGRNYSLNHLSIPDNLLMTHNEEIITHAEFYFARKLGLHKISKRYLYDKSFDCYVPEYFSVKDIIVNGYFQSAKNFIDYDDIIRREFRVSVDPSDENKRMIDELMNCESVCVHVRRGDYLNVKYGNVCDCRYYYEAMKYIYERMKNKNPVYYFFSTSHEDILWLKENYRFPEFNVKYIDFDNPDYEELRLMYSCRHFVIANSTFSWWGSYLSENQNKIICAPSRWIDDIDIRKTNIYLDDWVIIN